ncbi:hypothetical protein L208DRAFT_308647 [Tricholoma matsutake]|nr:hypothetical protein L208DRAFT_308647 [Tricholoma matsutake 945]
MCRKLEYLPNQYYYQSSMSSSTSSAASQSIAVSSVTSCWLTGDTMASGTDDLSLLCSL